MRHIIYTTILMLFILTGCEKAPINTDVEGFWRMKEFTVLSTEETTKCKDMFYSITYMVAEVKGAESGTYVARTEYRDNETKLVLKEFMVRSDTSDTGEKAPVEGLRNYGINSQEETVFDIVKCDGKKMTLQSDYARIELEKF